MEIDLRFHKRFNRDNLSVVLNCGEPLTLPDGSALGSFSSGLYKGTDFTGEKLIIIEVGNSPEVSEGMADAFRKQWSHVYDIFHLDQFKGIDCYRSPRVEHGELAFSVFYFGDNLPGSLHKDHDFFELHTQLMGRGEMQKFRKDDEATIYDIVAMSPGYTHKPFFDSKMQYPWHRYKSVTRSLLLAIESKYSIPK